MPQFRRVALLPHRPVMFPLPALRPLLLLAVAATVTACAALSPPPPPAAAPVAAPRTETPAAPVATEPPRAVNTPATSRPAAPASPAPAAIPNDPTVLVGLSQEQASSMLGTPSSIRQETPATVWAYRMGDCQLDLFFYEDVKTKKQQALAYELQTRDKTDQAQRACFNRIWIAKNGRP